MTWSWVIWWRRGCFAASMSTCSGISLEYDISYVFYWSQRRTYDVLYLRICSLWHLRTHTNVTTYPTVPLLNFWIFLCELTETSRQLRHCNNCLNFWSAKKSQRSKMTVESKKDPADAKKGESGTVDVCKFVQTLAQSDALWPWIKLLFCLKWCKRSSKWFEVRKLTENVSVLQETRPLGILDSQSECRRLSSSFLVAEDCTKMQTAQLQLQL